MQCFILVTITRSHTAHKFVHSALYTLHIFCVGCTAAAYTQGRLVCRTANQKSGFYSRQAYIQGGFYTRLYGTDFTQKPKFMCTWQYN